MKLFFQRIIESKRVHRERLASRPPGEKLRLLDALRERELALRGSANRSRVVRKDILSPWIHSE